MQQSEIEFYGTIAEGFEQRIRPFLNDLEDKIKDSSYQDQGSDKAHVEFIKGSSTTINSFVIISAAMTVGTRESGMMIRISSPSKEKIRILLRRSLYQVAISLNR